MKSSKSLNVSILSALTAITIFGFQNCAPTQFKEATGATGFKLAAADESEQDSQGDDVAVRESESEEEMREPSDDASRPSCEDKKDVKKDDVVKGSGGQDVPKDVVEEEDSMEENLVECDMGRPNSKVILSAVLKASPSNSSATRVCMSENACLKIINAFAAKRDCSLSKPVSGESDKQCTQVFPGSRGTCKNAAKVSDAEVEALLKSME